MEHQIVTLPSLVLSLCCFISIGVAILIALVTWKISDGIFEVAERIFTSLLFFLLVFLATFCTTILFASVLAAFIQF